MLPFYAYLLAHSMNLLVQESMLELFSFRCQTVKLCLTRVFHTNFDFFWGGDSSPPKGEAEFNIICQRADDSLSEVQ